MLFVTLNISENQKHFRHIVLFYYRRNRNALQICKKIAIYRVNAINDSIRRKIYSMQRFLF